MKNNSQVRVAVIGGGIGGASAAIALRKEGFDVQVYEQAPELKEVGAGIGLRPPSVQCFKDWGIFEAIEAVSTQSSHMEILASNGTLLIKEQWPLLTANEDEKWARLIHRADLLDTLIAQLPKESVHLNHQCIDIVDHGNYAEVEFANGTKIEADLVIAADGIRSPIRKKLMEDVDAVYSGFYAYRALVKQDQTNGMASEENMLRIYVDGDAQVYLLPLETRGEVSVDITVPVEEFSWRPDVTKDDLLESVKNYDPKIKKIIEDLDFASITCRPLCDIEALNKWTTKSVALIGDAAHAMLHNQGQGANMAIQDGGALALALRESETVEEALVKYSEKRIPLGHLYQKLSRIFPSQQAETAFPEKAHF